MCQHTACTLILIRSATTWTSQQHEEEKQAHVRATNGCNIQEMDDEEDSWSKSITALAHKRQHQNLSTSVPVQRQRLHRQKPTLHLSPGSIWRRSVQRGQWRWQRAVMFAHTEFCNWFLSFKMQMSAAIMLLCGEVRIYQLLDGFQPTFQDACAEDGDRHHCTGI